MLHFTFVMLNLLLSNSDNWNSLQQKNSMNRDIGPTSLAGKQTSLLFVTKDPVTKICKSKTMQRKQVKRIKILQRRWTISSGWWLPIAAPGNKLCGVLEVRDIHPTQTVRHSHHDLTARKWSEESQHHSIYLKYTCFAYIQIITS